MRKKIITMAVTLLLLGLLSAVEQVAVKRLTGDAMARTQEILSLLAQNQTARGLERARGWRRSSTTRRRTVCELRCGGWWRRWRWGIGTARLSMPESWRAASSMFWSGRRCRGRICCKAAG